MLENVSTFEIVLAIWALINFGILVVVINHMINNRNNDNFDLSKSEQDRIWKNICKELDFKDDIENDNK